MPKLQIYKIIKEWQEDDAEKRINELALEGYRVVSVHSSNYITVIMARDYEEDELPPSTPGPKKEE